VVLGCRAWNFLPHDVKWLPTHGRFVSALKGMYRGWIKSGRDKISARGPQFGPNLYDVVYNQNNELTPKNSNLIFRSSKLTSPCMHYMINRIKMSIFHTRKSN
jgi:hypothetical protein